MSITLKAAGIVQGYPFTLKMSMKERMEIDSATRMLVGTVSGRISISVKGYGSESMAIEPTVVDLELPVEMDASWELVIDARPVGSKIGGTGEIVLSNGSTYGFSVKVRCAAIEALGHTTDDATPFILSHAGDADAGVRAAAGWALALSENPGEIRTQLLGWLKQEDDASVRLRLYQALVRQQNVRAGDLLPLVRRETDAEARLAALGLLADAVRADGASDAGRYFESDAVSELKTAVYHSSRLDQSLAVIMALGRAGTPSSVALLGEIADHPTDPALRAAARQALKRNAADGAPQ